MSERQQWAYPEPFKREAVDWTATSGLPIVRVAGVSPNWREFLTATAVSQAGYPLMVRAEILHEGKGFGWVKPAKKSDALTSV